MMVEINVATISDRATLASEAAFTATGALEVAVLAAEDTLLEEVPVETVVVEIVFVPERVDREFVEEVVIMLEVVDSAAVEKEVVEVVKVSSVVESCAFAITAGAAETVWTRVLVVAKPRSSQPVVVMVEITLLP